MSAKFIFLKTIILEDLRRQWTIMEMAESVKLTPGHLQRMFKDEAGISPMKWLHDLRLEKAKEFLETTFLRVNQIGYQVGINDQSHFTRDFKKKYGLPPEEYREWYHKNLESENKNDKE